MDLSRIIQLVVVLLGVPAVLVGYVALVEWLMQRLPPKRQPQVRPWLWIGPGLLLLTMYLVYPTLNTIYLSLLNAKSTEFVGLKNYVYALTNRDMLLAIRNNVIWLVFFPLVTVALGLLIAVLTDRVRYESVAKALIFLPMAISSVAAGVIWKFMYDYRPIGQAQTGTLNAVVTTFGAQPQPWLIQQPSNNAFLIFVAVWMTAGFAMVILSAGLKGISDEVLEAARVDGANEWNLFWQIKIPLLSSTIAVVATTTIISALKTFDIVYVMTNGNYNTDVVARLMYQQLFNVRDYGRASAIAVVLLVAIVPIMIINIRRFREQEAMR
jgi:alpha-glucoside transport system permease protein